MKVAITYNIKVRDNTTGIEDYYAEFDDLETIMAIGSALSSRYEVVFIEADENAYNRLRKERPDIVFNIAEGIRGLYRESHIPAILELLGIPYTGSDPLTLAECLDKARCKEILSHHGIPTPAFAVIYDMNYTPVLPEYPLILKPLREGSSKGIRNSSLVFTEDEFLRECRRIFEVYNEPVLVEKFLKGREFTVSLIGNDDHIRVLPIIEIKFDELPEGSNPIYSYEAKWIWDTKEWPLNIFECPARLEPSLEKKIMDVSIKAFKALRCRDWCRIDIRLDENDEPNVLELNPLPGIIPDPRCNSCFSKAARTAGLSYEEMVNEILNCAMRRYNII